MTLAYNEQSNTEHDYVDCRQIYHFFLCQPNVVVTQVKEIHEIS